MRDPQLVHRLQLLPRLANRVKKVNLPVAVRVLPSNEDDLRCRDGECRAGPERVPHSDRVDEPIVLLDLEHLYRIVDLLLRATEKAAKRIDKLVIDRTR